MLPLVHSFRPLSSLHIGRSVGRPLEPRNETSFNEHKYKDQDKLQGLHRGAKMFLLVCISGHRVPSLILIHVNAPDISLLVHLSRISCRKHMDE